MPFHTSCCYNAQLILIGWSIRLWLTPSRTALPISAGNRSTRVRRTPITHSFWMHSPATHTQFKLDYLTCVKNNNQNELWQTFLCNKSDHSVCPARLVMFSAGCWMTQILWRIFEQSYDLLLQLLWGGSSKTNSHNVVNAFLYKVTTHYYTTLMLQISYSFLRI